MSDLPRRTIMMYINNLAFEWDEANTQKNWEGHGVTPEQAEDVFFNEPLVVRSGVQHSKREKRYYALGRTDGERYLFVAFTIRGRHMSPPRHLKCFRKFRRIR